MAKKKGTSASPSNGPVANLGFEANLWLTADSRCNNMDSAENRSKDVFDSLGRVYEYFFTQFASAEGKNGGQFYTPRYAVRVLVEMLAPYKGRVVDPRCGSAGMFVQSEKFVEEHGGRIGDIAVYGQESNSTTRRLAMMNLAIRGIEGDFGPEYADTFRRELHKDLKAEFVLANPPFNASDWRRSDKRIVFQFDRIAAAHTAKESG